MDVHMVFISMKNSQEKTPFQKPSFTGRIQTYFPEKRMLMDYFQKPGDWLLFQKDALFVKSKTPLSLPSAEDEPFFRDILLRQGSLSEARGSFLWGEFPGEETLPPGFQQVGLRELWALGGDRIFQAAGTAFQMMDWQRSTLYCSRCGAAMVPSDFDHGYRCPRCEFLSYPVLCPAVIVAVVREGKLLLARNVNFPKGRYSVLAGFVEPGESLEEAVQREIFEEVSIKVKNITYFGSQPWPFPHSLMLGFTADWAEGELTPDGVEIEDAGWFTPETMPEIPPSMSISRRLIDNWLAGCMPGKES